MTTYETIMIDGAGPGVVTLWDYPVRDNPDCPVRDIDNQFTENGCWPEVEDFITPDPDPYAVEVPPFVAIDEGLYETCQAENTATDEIHLRMK